MTRGCINSQRVWAKRPFNSSICFCKESMAWPVQLAGGWVVRVPWCCNQLPWIHTRPSLQSFLQGKKGLGLWDLEPFTPKKTHEVLLFLTNLQARHTVVPLWSGTQKGTILTPLPPCPSKRRFIKFPHHNPHYYQWWSHVGLKVRKS